MKNTQILEMINTNQIEELKLLLQDEIYKGALKSDKTAKNRYLAMKRYFKYTNNAKPALALPCKNIKIDGCLYNSFIDGYSFALTSESLGEMETYDNSKGDYFNIASLVNFSKATSVEKINLNEVLAKAKSKGYKFKKTEIVGTDFQYVFKYKDAYFKIGLFDKAFSIVNDNEESEVYYINKLAPMLIKTSIGIAGVCPFSPGNGVDYIKTIIQDSEIKKGGCKYEL